MWTTASPSASVTIADDVVTLVTDDTPAGYQIMSQAVAVPAGQVPVVRLQGRVEQGVIAVGLLNAARDKWLGTRTLKTRSSSTLRVLHSLRSW
jgi:hypothetical protein